MVELVAKKLVANRRTPKHQWQSFYHEISNFMDCDGTYLSGLSVLLGNDRKLHNSMTRDLIEAGDVRPTRRRRRRLVTAVFSPPDPRRSSATDDLEVNPPAKLSERFAFLNSKLPWHGELSNARKYLEEHNLVEEFDRVAVLSHLSRTLKGEKNKEVLRGGLRWAFFLWRQPRSHDRPIRLQPQHQFRVPTLNGEYVNASEAFFSSDWPDETSGRLLKKFLDIAPRGVPDLERVKNKMLAKPSHPAFLGKLIDDWVLFLKELGVNSGLTPELKSTKHNFFPKFKVKNFEFAQDYGIPIEFNEFWKGDILERDESLLDLPSTTNYVLKGDLWLVSRAIRYR